VERFDAVVIGAGQGGDPLARTWGGAGKRVALIERRFVGGTCVNTGCTPTKALAASARIAHLARRMAEFGVHGGGEITVNMPEVTARAQAIVQDFRQGTENGLLAKGVAIIYGQARFTGAKTLKVALNDGGGERELTAEQIFIDVGTRSKVPDIPGLSDVAYLDNAAIEHLESVPEHLLILGGSYIALEFGQMFRRFGSRVTLIEQTERVLAREDADVSETITDILREDGLEIYTSAQATRVAKYGDGVQITIRTSGEEKTIKGSHLFLATGRTPNTDDLGLDAAGVETNEHGFVKTNSHLETSAPGIYALGDCKGGPQFTHVSYDDFRVLCARLMDGKNADIAGRLVPYTVFIDPQLGRVGMTEREARDAGHEVRVANLPLTETARGIETSETRGLMKAVVDAADGQILGCAILTAEGGEVMTVVQAAMLGRLPYTALRDGVFAHPTLAESLNNLFMALDPAPPTPLAGQTRRGP
jgi:pyruvate/2-oxoglutarate dehydrogenase complex dihydrolipoamide dehydrogenase (E3) component